MNFSPLLYRIDWNLSLKIKYLKRLQLQEKVLHDDRALQQMMLSNTLPNKRY